MGEKLSLEKSDVKNMVANIKNSEISDGTVSRDYSDSGLKSVEKFYKCAELCIDLVKEYKLILERDTKKIDNAIDNLIETDENNKKLTESTLSK